MELQHLVFIIAVDFSQRIAKKNISGFSQARLLIFIAILPNTCGLDPSARYK
jgi:hypothetical protein